MLKRRWKEYKNKLKRRLEGVSYIEDKLCFGKTKKSLLISAIQEEKRCATAEIGFSHDAQEKNKFKRSF